jgi:hypothetical protein
VERKKKDDLDYEPGHKLSDPDPAPDIAGYDNGLDLSAIAKDQGADEQTDEEGLSVGGGYADEGGADEDEDDEEDLFHN